MLGFANMTIDTDFVKNFVGPIDGNQIVTPSGKIYDPTTRYYYDPATGENYTSSGEPIGPTNKGTDKDVVVFVKKPFPWWILVVAAGTWYITNKG